MRRINTPLLIVRLLGSPLLRNPDLMPVFETPAEYLTECWESVRAQTFREWELVLVDDREQGAAATIREIDRIAR